LRGQHLAQRGEGIHGNRRVRRAIMVWAASTSNRMMDTSDQAPKSGFAGELRPASAA
jgi:hypothetical protein